ncbi:tetratricopeptide repeat protein [Dactylosporangium sp. NPDC051485]|uniref:tetratricopeptide repeat protein n=1 Tax=Dactylosporangium sp. NPDC051485 TaxID=3154846 RepID=UPI00343F59BE
MSAVDVTDRLDAVERLIAAWDFPGAREVVQELLDEPGLSDDDRLTTRRLLAEALRELGEIDRAYDLAEAVAAQAERRYGQVHPATVHAVAVLAAVRHDYDEWDEAERLYHRVLDSGIDEEGDAPVCRAVRLARVNLALLQRDRGETALALSLLNAAYVIHRREYGADDLDTIRIAAELAALQHARGDVAAARRLFTLAHAAARARLGTRHPFTKAVEWELAAVEPPMPSAPVTAPPAIDPVRVAEPARVADPVRVAEPARAVEPARVAGDGPQPARRVWSAWPLVSVVVVLVAASVLAVLLLWHRPSGAPAPLAVASAPVSVAVAVPPASASAPVSVAGSVPPGVRALRLVDGRTKLTVIWAPLPVTVVIAVSKASAPAVVVGSVPAGTGEYDIHDIAPGQPYCVVVGPLDDQASVTPAASVCTGHR